MKRFTSHLLAIALAASGLATGATLVLPDVAAAACTYSGYRYAALNGYQWSPGQPAPDPAEDSRFYSTIKYQIGYTCNQQVQSIKVVTVTFKMDAKNKWVDDPPTLWRIGIVKNPDASWWTKITWSMDAGPRCTPTTDGGNCSFTYVWSPGPAGEFSYSASTMKPQVIYDCNCGDGISGDSPIRLRHEDFPADDKMTIDGENNCFWITQTGPTAC